MWYVHVGTAVVPSVEFKFPGSVAASFEFAVGEMIFIVLEGGVGSRPGSRDTSRQVALTRRCVSRRWKRRPHLENLARVEGFVRMGVVRCRAKQ